MLQPSSTLMSGIAISSLARHCEERSDEAIQRGAAELDCFAPPPMTVRGSFGGPRLPRQPWPARAQGVSDMAMTMNGEYQLPAPQQTVWEKLNDPAVLKACIPGCESLEKTSDTGFQAVA